VTNLSGEKEISFAPLIERMFNKRQTLREQVQYFDSLIELLERLEKTYKAFQGVTLCCLQDFLGVGDLTFSLQVPSLSTLELLMKIYKDFSHPLIEKITVEGLIHEKTQINVHVKLKSLF
jgi:CII-binding regulator of phage lambda lysogenization HflD